MSKDAGERTRFNEWLQCNGADEEFIKSLASCGFNSKLSLRFLDVNSAEGKSLTERFNYGQRCLLTGLIQLCKKENPCSDPFKAVSAAAKSISTTSKEISSLFPTMQGEHSVCIPCVHDHCGHCRAVNLHIGKVSQLGVLVTWTHNM